MFYHLFLSDADKVIPIFLTGWDNPAVHQKMKEAKVWWIFKGSVVSHLHLLSRNYTLYVMLVWKKADRKGNENYINLLLTYVIFLTNQFRFTSFYWILEAFSFEKVLLWWNEECQPSHPYLCSSTREKTVLKLTWLPSLTGGQARVMLSAGGELRCSEFWNVLHTTPPFSLWSCEESLQLSRRSFL